MQAKKIALATLMSVAFAGSAFAAQPAAGEGPLFLEDAVAQSTVSRAEVMKQAIANPPSADAPNVFAAKANISAPEAKYTRADVRKQTREAIAGGFMVKSGEMS